MQQQQNPDQQQQQGKSGSSYSSQDEVQQFANDLQPNGGLNENQRQRITNIEQSAQSFMSTLQSNVTAGPERSTAARHIVEGADWGRRAIEHGK